MFLLLLVAILIAPAAAAPLSLTPDTPYGLPPGTLQYLSSSASGVSWTVSSQIWGITVPATIPGDLVTDLQSAGVIGDPYYELGFLNTTTPGHQGAPLWDVGIWSYNLTFPLTLATPPPGSTFFLVFDGVKMAADITLNGVYIGAVMDQFLRYTFPLPPGLIQPTGNTLTLAFGTSRDERNAEGRFSGASGGWDWGSLQSTSTTGTRVGGGPQFTFSKGLWRDVYIASLPPSTAAIEHLSPYVYHLGAYPVSPLSDSTAGPWRVDVRVQLRGGVVSGGSHGTLSVVGGWGGEGSTNSTTLTLPDAASSPNSTVITLSLTVPQGAVSLWWPNEVGAQTLYNVSATWLPEGASPSSSPSTTSRSMGFRTFAIVTGDDTTDPGALAGVDGSGNLTVRWKVNGANLALRGADIIPMEVLDGRSSDVALAAMVASARVAHFNMLRVDGIDTYLPDVFYSLCDAAGILVYQDMQYSQGNPAPTANALETAELIHTVRRLAYHPSLGAYNGCNECGGHGIYASFVMTVVAEEDSSRPPWPSSPSNGWLSGVDRLTSLPNGSPLGLQPTGVLPLTGGAVSGNGGSGGRVGRGGDERALAKALRNAALLLAAAGNSAVAEGGGGGAGNCTLLPNLDICPGDPACLNQPHPQAATPQDCCDACAAAGSSSCAASTFYQGTCWFKPPGFPLVSVSGTVLCWPAGKPLPPAPTPAPIPIQHSREQHGPYVHGSGFPAVNGQPEFASIGDDGPLPPVFLGLLTMGPTLPGVSISEFGCPATSSFESYAPTLAGPGHWGLHGSGVREDCRGGFFRNCSDPASGLPANPMAQRNYPMDSIIAYYFGGRGVLPSLDAVGEQAFRRQLYLGLLAPALQQKSHMEALRAYPTWMVSFWALNEVWPTNGWGSVEYGPAGTGTGSTPGQVVGGRWKPLHYWLLSHLFTHTFVACDASGACLVRNDHPLLPLNVTLTVSAVSTITGEVVAMVGGPKNKTGSVGGRDDDVQTPPLSGSSSSTTPSPPSIPIALPPGGGAFAWVCMDGVGSPPLCTPPSTLLARAGCASNGTDCAIVSVVGDAGTGREVVRNVQLWALPSDLTLSPPGTVALSAVVGGGIDPSDGGVPVTLTVTGGAALLVLLSSGAQGRWSDNAMPVLAPGTYTLKFLPMLPPGTDIGGGVPPVDPAILNATLRIEHLGQYL